ncbi:MAG: hydrogenase maturation protease, partial [Anaerolineales bacterium]|nr:hydrogenase maturation protease [Anaerolineales bacterium]
SVDISPRILIIGYGNPLRGDDGLGWRAAERLAAEWPEVETLTCQQLTPELAEPISRAARVVFLDAAAHGPPGTIHEQTLRPDTSAPASFTHHITPGMLLALSEKLFGHVPQAVLFSVAGESFEFGQALSPPVEAALPEVIRRIREWGQR